MQLQDNEVTGKREVTGEREVRHPWQLLVSLFNLYSLSPTPESAFAFSVVLGKHTSREALNHDPSLITLPPVQIEGVVQAIKKRLKLADNQISVVQSLVAKVRKGCIWLVVAFSPIDCGTDRLLLCFTPTWMLSD